jgi:L-cystine transport system substrate-binding protein
MYGINYIVNIYAYHVNLGGSLVKRTVILFFTLAFVVVTACTGRSAQRNQNNGGIRTVTVAYSATSRPMNYINDAGVADGYEVQVLKEIDALLPQYNFVFVPIPDDTDLLIGIETGKYDLGVKAAWITEERLLKYVFPKHPIGASSIGLVYRASDKERYTDLEGFARAKGKLIPISPMNAQYNVILDFNDQHPATPIELIASETFSVADAYRWILEGRYDGYFSTKTSYLRTIKEEGSPYHQYDKDIEYFVHRSLPVWPLFNRSQQELADACDEAFLVLLENGRINEIMFEYLDENTFSYILEEEYQYLRP